MREKIKMQLSAAAAAATLFVGKVAGAVYGSIENPGGAGFQTDLSAIINQILNAILGVAALISVIYIVVGGFTYLTSAGNSESVTKAKNTLIYAIIGLVVIAAAFAIKTWATRLLLGTDVGISGTGL